VAELSVTATLMSVASALIESSAMSPTLVMLLSPKLTLSPKVLFVSVSVVALPTSVSALAGRTTVTFPEYAECGAACSCV